MGLNNEETTNIYSNSNSIHPSAQPNFHSHYIYACIHIQNGPPKSNIPATLEAYIAPLKESSTPAVKPNKPKWGGADYCVRCCKFPSDFLAAFTPRVE